MGRGVFKKPIYLLISVEKVYNRERNAKTISSQNVYQYFSTCEGFLLMNIYIVNKVADNLHVDHISPRASVDEMKCFRLC